MVIVKVDLPSNLDTQFKTKVIEKFGLKRGAISSALVEAIKLWINNDGEIYANNKNTGKKNEVIIPEDLKNKYLALINQEIVVVANSIEELWDEISPNPDEHYEIYTPLMEDRREVKLGWLGSFKRK